MTQEISIKYICNNCGKLVRDTPVGEIYGPLCVQILSPGGFYEGPSEVDFCSPTCASKFFGNNVLPERVS